MTFIYIWLTKVALVCTDVHENEVVFKFSSIFQIWHGLVEFELILVLSKFLSEDLFVVSPCKR